MKKKLINKIKKYNNYSLKELKEVKGYIILSIYSLNKLIYVQDLHWGHELPLVPIETFLL